MYVSVKQWKLLHLNPNINTKILIIHSLVTTKAFKTIKSQLCAVKSRNEDILRYIRCEFYFLTFLIMQFKRG